MTESNSEVNERNLRRVVDLCYEMLEIADHGDLFRTDDGCGILYGMLRDDAYKLRQIAEREIKAHEKQVKSKKKKR